jgi:hypothetical protein
VNHDPPSPLHLLWLRSQDAVRGLSRWALPALWCAVLWTDAYPVNAPGQQLYQQVRVELCDTVTVVKTRLYRDVRTKAGLEEQEVRPWEEVARRASQPKPPAPSAPTPTTSPLSPTMIP